jgi:hypothetical protein
MLKIMRSFQNFTNQQVSRSVHAHLHVALRPQVKLQKAKRSIKAPCCHKTMLACVAATHFPRAKTPYSASFPVPEGAECWPWRSTLVGLAAPKLEKLSTEQRSYPQKIYENLAFP